MLMFHTYEITQDRSAPQNDSFLGVTMETGQDKSPHYKHQGSWSDSW